MLREITIHANIFTGEMEVVSENIIPGELEVTSDYCNKILDRIAADKEEKEKKAKN